jgi:hypothetical protein
VFIEAGTEGTGSKIDLKKRAKFLQNPGKCESSEGQTMGTNWNCHERAHRSQGIPGKETPNVAGGTVQKHPRARASTSKWLGGTEREKGLTGANSDESRAG